MTLLKNRVVRMDSAIGRFSRQGDIDRLTVTVRDGKPDDVRRASVTIAFLEGNIKTVPLSLGL